jgi:hypothetical protein
LKSPASTGLFFWVECSGIRDSARQLENELSGAPDLPVVEHGSAVGVTLSP